MKWKTFLRDAFYQAMNFDNSFHPPLSFNSNQIIANLPSFSKIYLKNRPLFILDKTQSVAAKFMMTGNTYFCYDEQWDVSMEMADDAT